MEKVLLIESNDQLVKTLNDLLSRANFDINAVNNSIEGLCEIVKQRPDYILVASHVEKLNVFQLCTLLKNKKGFEQIPIIVMLTKEDVLVRAKAKAAGADKFLCKPFGQSELLAVLAKQQGKAA